MKNDRLHTAFVISLIIVVLAALAPAAGLFVPGLYRDNPFVTAVWRGNDLVTLFVAVPVFIIALVFAKRGSVRARLVWFGMLDYTLYNFSFYLFAAAFNAMFLVYTALFALSILALIFGLTGMDIRSLGKRFQSKKSVWWISIYMLCVAVGLATVYIIQSIQFIINGQIPIIIERTAHPTSVVFALDLSLFVPYLILGAVWIWKRRAWGFLLAIILNVKGAVYTLALASASFSLKLSGVVPSVDEAYLWLVLCVISFAVVVYILANLKDDVSL